MDKTFLKVTVYTVHSTLYQGEVEAVTSSNIRGTFDILPYHSQFISLIEKEVILHHENGEKRKFDLVRGIIHVVNNEAKIFLGIDMLGNMTLSKQE